MAPKAQTASVALRQSVGPREGLFRTELHCRRLCIGDEEGSKWNVVTIEHGFGPQPFEFGIGDPERHLGNRRDSAETNDVAGASHSGKKSRLSEHIGRELRRGEFDHSGFPVVPGRIIHAFE